MDGHKSEFKDNRSLLLSECLFLPSMAGRSVRNDIPSSYGSRSDNFAQDSSTFEIASTQAAQQVRVQTKGRRGDGQPLRLGICAGSHDRQRASGRCHSSSLQGLRIRRRRLRQNGLGRRSYSLQVSGQTGREGGDNLARASQALSKHAGFAAGAVRASGSSEGC